MSGRGGTGPPDSRPTVVVIGAVNVDLVVDTERLPRPGETVVGGSVHRHGGGKGANAAVAAARAGARTCLIAAVGDDDTGTEALAELRADGVDVSSVAIVPGTATGVALIVVSSSGENQIAVGAGANMHLSAEHVRAELTRLLPVADCVLVSTEIAPAAVTAAVEVTAGVVPCVLNPAPVTPAVIAALGRGPILTPNSGELADLCRALDPTLAASAGAPDFVERAAAVVARSTGSAVVVTRGEHGALLLEPGSDPVVIAPRPAAVVDTTGAGDTFNGVLAFRLAARDSIGRALEIASGAAALSIGAVGARTGMPGADVLVAFETSAN